MLALAYCAGMNPKDPSAIAADARDAALDDFGNFQSAANQTKSPDTESAEAWVTFPEPAAPLSD